MDRIPEDGSDDPVIGDADAGDTAGWVSTNDISADDGDVDYALGDPEAEADFADELVTNDAAGGETVWPGGGDGSEEVSPDYDEHDPDLDPDAGREEGL